MQLEDNDNDTILSAGLEEFDTDEVWEDLSEQEIAELEHWEKCGRLHKK